MRISDWSSDVCSSDLRATFSSLRNRSAGLFGDLGCSSPADLDDLLAAFPPGFGKLQRQTHIRLRQREHSNERSEEHTSELQSLMRISYAVFCLKKKKKTNTHSTIRKTRNINKITKTITTQDRKTSIT